MIAHFLFPGIVAAAQALICNSVVTLVVVVWPILRPPSRRDKRPYFLPQQSIMAVTCIVSAVSRCLSDFQVGLVISAGRAWASFVPLSDKSAQIISCVALSTARCSLRHPLRLSAPCCRTFHSPSPKTFRPVPSMTRCEISPRVGVFMLMFTVFARLLSSE